MVSIRRLRAVLLFAVISAIAWTVIGIVIMTVVRFVADMSITVAVLTRAATVFASLGFAAGATWSVAVAMLPRKDDQAVTALVATLAGALGGVLVATGMYIAMGNLSLKLLPANLVTLGMAGCIGGAVGLLIQRGATRGQLPPAGEPPRAIEE